MSLNIRPLKENDKAEWRRLWTNYLSFYESSVSESVYESTFNKIIDSEQHHRNALVAEKDGQLVGLVHFIYHAHNWRVEDVCYLQDLYVDQKLRGGGVGRALIEAVYEAADANGTPSVYWMTQDFNETARKLYDRIANLTPFIKYQR
ncbi:hypothetical protein L861_24060 [Litchfieldella anticariensis FP35 = DSM 16096]|uniref:N-acetyltransferase domain-containing protein n=1 Tax=Litchfieldella anticariensis (strain DSM 16096 / CECT 5854 / CIP 108499 / LMG 22089 / FP35) TaxID=1121939 RepID=S2KL99_LITA3|nr:GNAT family N-acetyltransferase [Halomonas anticariensis]EPC02887.1 hypothetical protein L861_24060 [Halomonas anticariensis FP35 = DSM 16096]